MKENLITKINGVDIITVDKDGETYVPIKPVCDALGIDAKTQRVKIQEDEFFASTGVIITSVAADEKERDMYCIRLRDVYGWLASINPGKVAPEAREAVTRYRRECYDVLYEHFAGRIERERERLDIERQLLDRQKHLRDAIDCNKKANDGMKKELEEIDRKFHQLQTERLNPQPTLF